MASPLPRGAGRAPGPVVDVAVGVLVRAGGAVLFGQRPAGKPYAGWWEFPGGKLEAGESVEQALARELHEELGLRVASSTPWVRFEFSYPHAHVRLHFCRVERWSGEPRAHEGQRLRFVDPFGELPTPLLPAAVPTLRWLCLPPLVAPSAVGGLGLAAFLAAMERAVGAGLRGVLVDEPGLDQGQRASVEREIALRLGAAGGSMVRLLNDARGPAGASTALPVPLWQGLRVRDTDDLRRAAACGCDFGLIGPVLPSGAAAEPAIGWPGFAAVARATPLPVFAFGGLAPGDLEVARRHGAHGVVLDADVWRRGVLGR